MFFFSFGFRGVGGGEGERSGKRKRKREGSDQEGFVLIYWKKTVRTNEQMMQAMKGATGVLGSMNRSMNLPALQRIAMEFEKENDIMDQRQEMMDDAIDDVTGLEDEEEGEEVVEQVLEEIGIDLKAAMGETPQGLQSQAVAEGRVAQAVGGGGGPGGADPGDDDLQARLDSLRRD